MSTSSTFGRTKSKFDPIKFAPRWLIGFLGWGPRRIDAVLSHAGHEGYTAETIHQAAEVVVLDLWISTASPDGPILRTFRPGPRCNRLYWE